MTEPEFPRRDAKDAPLWCALTRVMKKRGAITEYQQERAQELLRSYFLCLKNCKSIGSILDIYEQASLMPASRFWVSPRRAKNVVASIMRGDRLLRMRPTKRDMFFEIYRRVCQLREHYPDMILPHLVEKVVEQPAPRFYLSPISARVAIVQARKKWFAEQSKRRRRSCSR